MSLSSDFNSAFISRMYLLNLHITLESLRIPYFIYKNYELHKLNKVHFLRLLEVYYSTNRSSGLKRGESGKAKGEKMLSRSALYSDNLSIVIYSDNLKPILLLLLYSDYDILPMLPG